MAKKYLDYDGLLYFWQRIKTVFATKAEGVKTITRSGTTFTVTRADDTTFTFTQQDNTVAKTTTTPKMAGTAAIGSETKYAAGDHVHPSDSTKVDKVAGMGLSTNDYTTAEKTKLAGIASGAEVNQNAFSNVKVGSATIAADGKTDTLELVAGDHILLSPNPSDNTVTIAADLPEVCSNIIVETALTASDTGQIIISDPDVEFTKQEGSIVSITFKETPEYINEIEINSTGLEHVYYGENSGIEEGLIHAGDTVTFIYRDGSDTSAVHPGYYLIAINSATHGVCFGVCRTAGATSEKTVECPGFKLYIGAAIYVHFTLYNNTASVGSLTLNVNGTGAKPIRYRGSNLTSAGIISVGRIYCFVYDGNYWQISGDLDTNTTYTNAALGQGYGTCATAEATAAKVVTLSGYSLVVGGIVSVKFTYAVPANATMNINSKGTKPIFSQGAAITAGIIPAGRTATFIYDGTNYHLISIDGVREDMGQIADALDTKVDKVSGKGLSTNDYTTAEKNKLAGIAAGAQVNQNAFSNVTVGSTTIAADAKTDTLTFVAGSNVTLTPDATNDKITIAATDTTYSDATTSAHGLMTAADKTKLNKLVFDSNNLIDSSILPSYVDDVIEAYPRSGQTELSSAWLATGSASGSVITPETGKIYVLMADSTSYATNTQFRWSGTAYVKLNDGGVSAITNAEIDTIVAS